MISGFTRQEAIALTNIKSGDLSYWDSSGLVSPHKVGNLKRPVAIYSPEQVIELLIVKYFRASVSLGRLRQALVLLRFHEIDYLIKAKLYFVDDRPCLILKSCTIGHVVHDHLKRSSCTEVVVTKVGAIADALVPLKTSEAAKNILDFDKRIAGTPLERIMKAES